MKYKCTIKYIMVLIGVLVVWLLFLWYGHINWDIDVVAHRTMFGLMVIVSIIEAVGVVVYYCERKKIK